MSWERGYIYRCSVCGDTAHSKLRNVLPDTWHGDKGKNGNCVCSDCYLAMNIVKLRLGEKKEMEER